MTKSITVVEQGVERARTGPLVPLTRQEVAEVEANARVLGLPSLLSLAEGVDDDDIPYPLESDMHFDEEPFDPAFMNIEEENLWD